MVLHLCKLLPRLMADLKSFPNRPGIYLLAVLGGSLVKSKWFLAKSKAVLDASKWSLFILSSSVNSGWPADRACRALRSEASELVALCLKLASASFGCGATSLA